MSNLLVHESSAYLRQHAENPINWRPWGKAAIEEAKRDNKLIFLSIGYSSCYWCHVMERLCFKDAALAEVMNQYYICIKVDREERPDLDLYFMTCARVLGQGGGWPNNLFLSPDLKPFYAVTFLPANDFNGRIGLTRLATQLHLAWTDRKSSTLDICNEASEMTLRALKPRRENAHRFEEEQGEMEVLMQYLAADYDPHHHGYGSGPKFPQQPRLLMGLHALQRPVPHEKILHRQITGTLDAMAMGGIRDHLSGGFHRYATDSQWRIPHFEILLSDNALLARVYAMAGHLFREPRYEAVAREILLFIQSDLADPAGGFYSSMDAEVEGMEGESYLWTPDEIIEILGDGKGAWFNTYYGLDDGPNFQNPHHPEAPEKNVLFLKHYPDSNAQERLAPMRQKLLEARRKRKQPFLDKKVIASWNAMAISAFATAGALWNEKALLDKAKQTGEYLWLGHRDETGKVFRTGRDGDMPRVGGFLEDYAFLADAFMEIFRATGEELWRSRAADVAKQMVRRFGDDSGGGFYYSDHEEEPFIPRVKNADDSPTPSGNAIAAKVLIDLEDRARARGIIEEFADDMAREPRGMAAMMESLSRYIRRYGPFEIAGRETSVEDSRPRRVHFSASWSDSKTLRIGASIEDGWHINGNPAASGQKPTSLRVIGKSEGFAKDIIYPEPTKISTPLGPIDVYEGDLAFIIKFKESMIGKEDVRIMITYQACDGEKCEEEEREIYEVELK